VKSTQNGKQEGGVGGRECTKQGGKKSGERGGTKNKGGGGSKKKVPEKNEQQERKQRRRGQFALKRKNYRCSDEMPKAFGEQREEEAFRKDK